MTHRLNVHSKVAIFYLLIGMCVSMESARAQSSIEVLYEEHLLLGPNLESILGLKKAKDLSDAFAASAFVFRLQMHEGMSQYTFVEKRIDGDKPIVLSVVDYVQSDTLVLKTPHLSDENKYMRLEPYTSADWTILANDKELTSILGYRVICAELKGKPSIRAWFCPQLPYRHGPEEYSGLPGLILKVRSETSDVEAKEILPGGSESPNIQFPQNYTLIEDQDEWQKWITSNKSEFTR